MGQHAVLKETLEAMAAAVRGRDQKLLESAFDRAAGLGVGPDKALEALSSGFSRAREDFSSHVSSIPEFLLCAEVLQRGLERSKTLGGPRKPSKAPSVVIGVVEGDVHDLGKNVVAGVLRALGCKVTDLGRDVSEARFLEALAASQADVLALSTMMSTPVDAMARIVSACKGKYPDVLLLVGGAALDPVLAERMGADGYAENAGEVPALLESLERRPRGKKPSRVFVDYDQGVRVVETPADAPPAFRGKKK